MSAERKRQGMEREAWDRLQDGLVDAVDDDEREAVWDEYVDTMDRIECEYEQLIEWREEERRMRA